MERQAGAAGVDRVLILLRPPALFGELRKRNRRRILLDPASKVFNPRIVGHLLYGTTMLAVMVPVRAGTKLSVTVNVTTKVPAAP
jgi:hypothetical protein